MFESAELKIDRAHRQTNELNDAIGRFIADPDDPPYRWSIERNTDHRKWALVLRAVKKHPDIWAVHVGEILHNLRSALDHLVYEASDPALRNKRTEFPIFNDEAEFIRVAAPKIKGLNAATRAFVESNQPFTNKDTSIIHYLWLLYELSNTDKHRLLNFVSVGHALSQGRFQISPGERGMTDAHIPAVIGVPSEICLEDGAEYFSFSTREPLPDDANVHMNADIAVYVRFGDSTPSAQGQDVIDLFRRCTNFTVRVRNGFLERNL
jgi:hypothetical protein